MKLHNESKGNINVIAHKLLHQMLTDLNFFRWHT